MDLFDIAVASKLAGGGGGGGGSCVELLTTKSLGHVETSSTSATQIDSATFQREDFKDYDWILVITSTGAQATGTHYATISAFWVYTSKVPGCDGLVDCKNLNFSINSYDVLTSAAGNSTSYICGVYATATVSGTSVTIDFMSKYNSSYSRTINGDYTAKIYGVKLLDLI